MKASLPLILSVFAATGCVSTGALQGNRESAGPDHDTPARAAPATPDPFQSQAPDTMPRLIIPATGGPPVIGIPVGGGLYVPTTGGPPVIGIPTGP
jgi:hypothetical protein